MLLERQTTSNANNTNGFVDKNGHTYVSPALAGDLSIAYRFSPTMAVALGAVLLFETAGSDVTSTADGSQYLAGGKTGPVPLPTPAYHLATGAQTFVGPYLGLQFGP
jgi:hypothetical protein